MQIRAGGGGEGEVSGENDGFLCGGANGGKGEYVVKADSGDDGLFGGASGEGEYVVEQSRRPRGKEG